MGKWEGFLNGLRLGLKIEKGSSVTSIPEEEDGCYGGDEEKTNDDLVEVFREPGGEIKGFGRRETVILVVVVVVVVVVCMEGGREGA